MTDLYDKIIKYVYEIRMIEIDEYLYGMNRKKIDEEKAYDIISDAPISESNAIIYYILIFMALQSDWILLWLYQLLHCVR